MDATELQTHLDHGIYIKKAEDGLWCLMAQGSPRMTTPNLGELCAYVYGVWDGIKGMTGERPDHICPILGGDRIVLDTLIARDDSTRFPALDNEG